MIHFLFEGKLPPPLTTVLVEKLERTLTDALKQKQDRTVSVRFVSLPAMEKLNATYRHKKGPTDILSFDVPVVPGISDPTDDSLGDLVICLPYAKQEAKRRAIPFEEECIRLLTHGVLHLKGFDHATEKEEKNMFSLQEACVERVINI
ncbi:MAG: rRNA maturation RNase YbeY [bacterium]|nr:rRNA maturation RNase YbeY [bacterium]